MLYSDLYKAMMHVMLCCTTHYLLLIQSSIGWRRKHLFTAMTISLLIGKGDVHRYYVVEKPKQRPRVFLLVKFLHMSNNLFNPIFLNNKINVFYVHAVESWILRRLSCSEQIKYFCNLKLLHSAHVDPTNDSSTKLFSCSEVVPAKT